MSNKLQCPQCGASNSTKISETEHHCDYCDSNFTTGKKQEEYKGDAFKKSAEFKATIALQAETIGKQNKRKAILIFSIIGLLFCIIFFVSYKMRKGGKSYWSAPSVIQFDVFAGSKGPVIWYLEEFSGSGLDSAKFVLRIVDPATSSTLKEMNLVPVMTWKEGFDSNEFIGEQFAFGDTCWITSDRDGLIARDIYSGEIIVDAQKLGQVYPKLAGGVSKAKFDSDDNTFDLTSSDGLEYVFAPKTKTLVKKEEVVKSKSRDTSTVRTFFLVSTEMRPHLFKSVEKTSPRATTSKAFSHDLEKFDGTNFSALFNPSIISITKLNPDVVYFNGKIIFEDGNKTILYYQDNVNKKSALNIACINADGKERWKLGGTAMGDFSNAFAENNFNLKFITSENKLYMYMQYPSIRIIQIDIDSGKTGWYYKGE
jgi:hypothetical protein